MPDIVSVGTRWIGHILHRYTYLASYGLLHIEESGIPLPAPGDVFVVYVGAHVPRNLASWLIAWLGLVFVVVLGATNLFFISRRFGRRLAEGRFAHLVHLSPERLDRAETTPTRTSSLPLCPSCAATTSRRCLTSSPGSSGSPAT